MISMRTAPVHWTDVADTLLARVYLTPDRAYKVRRPVRTPFVDQRTAEQRRVLAEEEIRLNRDLAPGVHLRVLPVSERHGDMELVPVDRAAGATDYIVEMVRLDADDALPHLIRSGAAGSEEARRLGARLARFHETAERVSGATAELDRTIHVNLAELAHAARGVLDEGRVHDVGTMLLDGLRGRRSDLLGRERLGDAVDGHGDLRAEHVYFSPDGIKVIDRLEFDATLRHGDVAADLAFLVMDLERLGGRSFADAVVAGYRDAGGDPGDDELIALFGVHRALVRAKVALLRTPVAVTPARMHLELAERLAWRSTSSGEPLVICGPPASGKSTIASEVAQRTGWPVLSTDVLRKSSAGLRPTERASHTAYASARTLAVYRGLGAAAADMLATAGGVIVDGTFGHRAWRREFLDALPAGACFVECRVPQDELVLRARHRMADPGRVSDADVGITKALAESFESPFEVAPGRHLVVRADRPVRAVVREIARWRPD